MSTKTITHGGADYVLECTCSACPEQYNVRVDGVKVGYLRLRWGEFEVYYPDVEGTVIYSAEPESFFDGAFEDHERDGYLRAAVEAIARARQVASPGEELAKRRRSEARKDVVFVATLVFVFALSCIPGVLVFFSIRDGLVERIVEVFQ